MSITSNSPYEEIMSSGATTFLGGMVVFFVILAIISVAVSVFMIVCQYKIFSKNGKPGWYAIIPFLNTWTLFEIAGNKGWLSLIPFANIVFLYISNYKLAIKMGKSTGIAILVTLMPLIGYPILAFSKDNNVSENNLMENNQTNIPNEQPQNVEQPVVQNQQPTFIQTEPVVENPVQPEPVVQMPMQSEPVVSSPVQVEPVVEVPVQVTPVVETSVQSELVQPVNTNAVETPVSTQPSSLNTNVVPPVNNVEIPLNGNVTNTNMFTEPSVNNQSQVVNNMTSTFTNTTNDMNQLNNNNNNIQ